MKRLQTLIIVAAAMILFGLTACNRSVTRYVNPFVGTDLHGHTFPGAIVPFGMIQPSPDTRLEGWDGCSAYHYSDDTIYGFSHTHLSGTGCEDFGDILVMPFSDSISIDNKSYCSRFSHKNERAEPGYYSVILDKSRILAELTVTERTAVHRYSFPKNGTKGIIVDLTHRDKTLDCDVQFDAEKGLMTGYRHSSAWSPSQYCYFALVPNVPAESIEIYPAPEGKVVDGSKNCYAILYFPDDTKEVELHVAISAVDKEGAIANLKSDQKIPFQEARRQAHDLWEKELSKISVEGGSREDKRVFYTSLYHCFTSPYLYSDADGRYRGQNDSIYTVDEGRRVYTVFSLWDTYRTLHPLLNIIDRERTKDFIYTFAKCYETGGELPMWELASHETHCMIGYHAVPVIYDAYVAGILDDFSPEMKELLLEGMVKTANRTEAHKAYGAMGYLDSELDNESVSKTLEYSFDDWCIAQYATALEKEAPIVKVAPSEGTDPSLEADTSAVTLVAHSAIVKEYIRRCQSWKNIMDPNGFMHARRNGGFVTPFSPTEVNNHFTEANSMQYSTYVPHDLKGFFHMLGGNEKAEQFLDTLFHTTRQLEGREQSDIDGLIGQYAHGNEPSHHASYLYVYLARQWKTAELVRQICTQLYTSKPDGEIGNDDCGQMAAWFVMSAMGFYPVCPGSDHYAIGSPLFSKVTIHLENGKQLVINAQNANHKNAYVQSLSINGNATNCAFLEGKTIREGGVLDFVMGSTPNKEFGSEKVDQYITSLQDRDIQISAPYFTRWEQRFNDSISLEIKINTPEKCNIYYTLDGSRPDTSSLRYNGPIQVNSDMTLQAVAYSPKYGYSAVVKQHLTRYIADKKLTYVNKPDPQYHDSGEEGLIDRLYGTTNYRIGGWQGWQSDMEVVIDLLEEKTIHSVGANCLSDCRSWVFYPSGMEVQYSLDGKQYQSFGKSKDFAQKAMSDPNWNYKEDSRQQSFSVGGNASCRYLKVKVLNYGTLPGWHISAGQQAWLFIDEIEIQ